MTGFVIDIDSLLLLVPELLQRQRYVLTYKLSQDHLELLFNSVRASGMQDLILMNILCTSNTSVVQEPCLINSHYCSTKTVLINQHNIYNIVPSISVFSISFTGGWNNNPTSLQFQYYFRHLMVQCGVKAGATGNVTSQDETVSFAATDMAYVPLDEVESAASQFVAFDEVSLNNVLPSTHGSLTDNALTYIAGWVVRKMILNMVCSTCRGSLVIAAIPEEHSDNYHLLRLKNNGGLMIPSPGVVRVVKSAEMFIRHHLRIDRATTCSVDRVQRYVRQDIGNKDVFCLGNMHITDSQYGIDNHHYQLLDMTVSTFFILRQYHIAKLHTAFLQSGNTRKQSGKTVLFKGH